MLRSAGGVQGQKRPPLTIKQLTDMIGTQAKISLRPSVKPGSKMDEQGQDVWYTRVGMFETFEDMLALDVTHLVKVHMRDFHMYRARVVPWVKVLTRDIRYRVFEKKTVVDIIEAIASEAKQTYPHLLIDASALKNAQPAYTPMDYCVQFGESTFDFITRLMARFGIWYYFGHAKGDDPYLLNETMFLKGNWDHSLTTVGIGDVEITESGAGFREIGKLVQRFRPPERRVAVGGFNYLDPTNPFYKDGAVSPEDDLLENSEKPVTAAEVEILGQHQLCPTRVLNRRCYGTRQGRDLREPGRSLSPFWRQSKSNFHSWSYLSYR